MCMCVHLLFAERTKLKFSNTLIKGDEMCSIQAVLDCLKSISVNV